MLNDFDMGVESKDSVAQLLIEAGHDADDDDEHGHSQGDAEDGNQGDDRNKRPFGPEIPQRKQQFERQTRHWAEAKRPAGPCQRAAKVGLP
jgi:hypothetical protein